MEKLKSNAQKMKVGGILDSLICLLLFIISVHKGGFYKEDILFPNLVVCVLGLVCLVIKIVWNIKENRVLNKSILVTIIDTCAIILPVAYFMPVIFKTYASLESAISESIRYVGLAIIYFIVRSTNNKGIYVYTIIAIGVVLAITGIDEITYRGIENILSVVSIRYLANSNGRISSTIQYANITALIMFISSIFLLSKILKKAEKLLEIRSVTNALKFPIEITLFILLQSAVILTTSRMNIFLIVISAVIYSTYMFINKENKKALSIILLTIIPFILVSSIEEYLLTKQYSMIYITFILTYIVAAGFTLLKYYIVSKEKSNKIKEKLNKLPAISNKRLSKKILLLLIPIALITVYVLLTAPTALKVDKKSGSVTEVVSRNIYNFKKDATNDLSIDLNASSEGEYKIEICEILEDFRKEPVIFTKNIKNNEINSINEKINIGPNTIRLKFIVTVIKGEVSVNSVKINGEKETLSYLFIPDTVVFRLKDTLSSDLNNKLRMEYYKDAFKLSKISPVIGIGGEGFKTRYQEVQESAYISSEVHSVPLQILVESGIIGFSTYIAICAVILFISILLIRKKENMGIIYFITFICYLLASSFDLVFSFDIMICLFATFVGIVVNDYKNIEISKKDLYLLDNKSTIGMIKMAILSACTIVLVITTVYSFRVYKASMIEVPEETEEFTLENTYNSVAYYEAKLKLDKYNLSYMSNLYTEYGKHISLLNNAYLSEEDSSTKRGIKEDINRYTQKQKNVVDDMILYEYYSKYALEQAADCYFENYLVYSIMYKDNFKSDEIAYSFYLGYAMKLTQRIYSIGMYNNVAKKMVRNIYETNIKRLKEQNRYLLSPSIDSVVKDIDKNLKNI